MEDKVPDAAKSLRELYEEWHILSEAGKVTGKYYFMYCLCGWMGSSEEAVSISYGDDEDVACPRCGNCEMDDPDPDPGRLATLEKEFAERLANMRISYESTGLGFSSYSGGWDDYTQEYYPVRPLVSLEDIEVIALWLRKMEEGLGRRDAVE